MRVDVLTQMQLGVNSTTASNVPIKVETLSGVVMIALGWVRFHFSATRDNVFGVAVFGTSVVVYWLGPCCENIFLQCVVVSLTTVVYLQSKMCAIAFGDALFCWGSNSAGNVSF